MCVIPVTAVVMRGHGEVSKYTPGQWMVASSECSGSFIQLSRSRTVAELKR